MSEGIKEREKILSEIKALEAQLERSHRLVDELRVSDKHDLAEEVRKKEIRLIDLQIAKKYQQFAESLERDYGQKVLSASDIFEMDLSEQRWIVSKLIPLEGITAISGTPGSFKSWLSVYIAKCVSEGKQVFGRFETVSGSVLIVDLESNLRLIRDRLKLLGLELRNNFYYWNGDFSLDQDRYIERLELVIKEKGIKLVIFDSLVRLHSADENDSRSMSLVFKRLKELTKLGLSIVFIHHSRKQSFLNRGGAGESMRGSSDILAAIDSHLLLVADGSNLKISQPKLRQDEPMKPINIKIVSGNGSFNFEYEGEVQEPLDKMEECRESIARLLEKGVLTRKELIASLKGVSGTVTIDRALKGMVADGLVKKDIGSSNIHIYSLVGTESEQEELVL